VRTGVAFAAMGIMTSVILSDHMVIIFAVAVLQATPFPLPAVLVLCSPPGPSEQRKGSQNSVAEWVWWWCSLLFRLQTLVFAELVAVRQDHRIETRKIPLFRSLNW